MENNSDTGKNLNLSQSPLLHIISIQNIPGKNLFFGSGWALFYNISFRLVAGGRSCNRQSVFLSTEESSKNNWVIDAYDPLMRLEYEDGPVPHGTSLIIKHGLTGQVSFIASIGYIIWTIQYCD